MKKDHTTIRVTAGTSLMELLDMVRRQGEVRVVDGEDVFVITRETVRLPERARGFLKNGGVDEAD